MLSTNYFYFGSIRKYISLFGSLFNDLLINRTNSNGNITQIINVPISYAQKEKMMVRLKQDPDINNPTEIILPRMSFFLDGIEYDNIRKPNSLSKIIYNFANNNVDFQFSPNPFNFYFSLYVYVKNNEDGAKIIEQILPFFKPQFTARMFLLPNQESQDIPIDFVSISHEDNDTESFKDNPVLIWTLRFNLRGFLYGPPTNNNPIIGEVKTEICFGSNPGNTQSINIYSFGMSSNNYQNNNILIPSEYIIVTANTSNGIYIDDWSQVNVTIEEV